jgi:uncharacterized membrane protein
MDFYTLGQISTLLVFLGFIMWAISQYKKVEKNKHKKKK